ncbi:hypothetical protein V1524DRAFT_410357 [Lipomyces starkeyi]
MDLVDFAGPLETLSHARDENHSRHTTITIAGPADEVEASQGLVVKHDISFEEATTDLTKFHVLVVLAPS